MSSDVDLVVDFCSYEAAKYAVTKWHYSKIMPAGKLVKIGVWENKQFIGCVLFGRGAIFNIGLPYDLPQNKICELVRVALKPHHSTTSKIISQSLKLLKKTNPNIKLVVSFADTEQKHFGIIYQATNWIYVGNSKNDSYLIINNKVQHPRSIYAKYGTQSLGWIKKHIDSNAKWYKKPPKFKYLMPLDKGVRKRVLPLAKDYPKKLS